MLWQKCEVTSHVNRPIDDCRTLCRATSPCARRCRMGAGFPAHPGRETRQKTSSMRVHQRPLLTSMCARLPWQLGSTLPCAGSDTIMNTKWTVCQASCGRTHKEQNKGAAFYQDRDPDSHQCPVPGRNCFYFYPSIQFQGNTSQPPRGSPVLPFQLSDVQTQQVLSLPSCRWQDHPKRTSQDRCELCPREIKSQCLRPLHVRIYTEQKELYC